MMYFASRFLTLLVLPVLSVLSAPTETHKPGDYVGVRAKAYEEKNPNVKFEKINIHPGVVMDHPDPESGKYPVAMISKKLPFDPPRDNINAFHPNSNLYGEVALHPPYHIKPEDMKPWKDDKTGERHVPMGAPGLHNLKVAMGPHTQWRPPTPPPLPPPPPPGPHRSPSSRATRRKSRSPIARNPHVNPHASSSRHPPAGYSSSFHRPSTGPPRAPHPVGGYGHSGPNVHAPSNGPRYPPLGGGHNGFSTSRPYTDNRRSSPPGSNTHRAYPARRAGERRSLDLYARFVSLFRRT